MTFKMMLSILVFMLIGLGDQVFSNMAVPEEDLYPCLHYAACIIQSKLELQKILAEFGSKGSEKLFSEMREIIGVSNAEDTPEFWKTYPETICSKSDEEKKSMFGVWGGRMTDFWSTSCENKDQEECEKCEKAFKMIGELVVKYSSSGKCGSSAKGMGAAKVPKLG